MNSEVVSLTTLYLTYLRDRLTGISPSEDINRSDNSTSPAVKKAPINSAALTNSSNESKADAAQLFDEVPTSNDRAQEIIHTRFMTRNSREPEKILPHYMRAKSSR